MKKDMCIMMIDDDPAAHIYHKVMMEQAGVELNGVKEFYDVDSGISHLKICLSEPNDNFLPEVIILDLNIPIKSGWDFIEEMKKLNLEAQLPQVYIVSNTENPQDEKRARSIKEVVDMVPKFLDKQFFENLVCA